MVSGAERNDWVPELAILKHAEEHFTPEGRPYYHNTRTTTWVDPRRQTIICVTGPNGGTEQYQSISQLGPLPSGWEQAD